MQRGKLLKKVGDKLKASKAEQENKVQLYTTLSYKLTYQGATNEIPGGTPKV